jgi:hypothetical protein
VSPGQRINVTLYEFGPSFTGTSSLPSRRTANDVEPFASRATGNQHGTPIGPSSGTISASSSSSTSFRVAGAASVPYGRLRELNSRRSPIEITLGGPYVGGGGPVERNEAAAGGDDSGDAAGPIDPHQQREWHVLTTETSTVEVVVYEVAGRDNYLLTFTGERIVDDVADSVVAIAPAVVVSTPQSLTANHSYRKYIVSFT